jgi:ABC-type Fe3+-hydroxamate transport system substrate-binding protein
MQSFTDQMNRTLHQERIPQRIISLVPSQTELLYDLGLEEEVVGITKFCIHPTEWFKTKTRVGGTKKIDFEKIKALRPDLIIGNKEENEQGQIEELMKLYPVWMSDIKNLEDALTMILNIGGLTGKTAPAAELVNSISLEFLKLQLPSVKRKAAYFIWRKPWMAAGKETFIDEMMQRCGLNNVFTQTRYPEVIPEALGELQPEIILLSSEPYPFKEKHIQEIREYCPAARILLVDGELFSWYGSRLLKAPAYFRGLIDFE